MPRATAVPEMPEAAGRRRPTSDGAVAAGPVVFTVVFDGLCDLPAAPEDRFAGAMPSPNKASSPSPDADLPVCAADDPSALEPREALPVLRASLSGMAYSVPAGLSGW
ncbi:MAG: hypothetical protein ABW167_18860 [Baekduia sp.]